MKPKISVRNLCFLCVSAVKIGHFNHSGAEMIPSDVNSASK
jgi:hypothetical protein